MSKRRYRLAADTIARRSRARASARAPTSDGSALTVAARTGTCRGSRSKARVIDSSTRGSVPHDPPMTMISGSAQRHQRGEDPADGLTEGARGRAGACGWRR